MMMQTPHNPSTSYAADHCYTYVGNSQLQTPIEQRQIYPTSTTCPRVRYRYRQRSRRKRKLFCQEEIEQYKIPLNFGWTREIVTGETRIDVYYHPPKEGRRWSKLRSIPDVHAYFNNCPSSFLHSGMFTFAKCPVIGCHGREIIRQSESGKRWSVSGYVNATNGEAGNNLDNKKKTLQGRLHTAHVRQSQSAILQTPQLSSDDELSIISCDEALSSISPDSLANGQDTKSAASPVLQVTDKDDGGEKYAVPPISVESNSEDGDEKHFAFEYVSFNDKSSLLYSPNSPSVDECSNVTETVEENDVHPELASDDVEGDDEMLNQSDAYSLHMSILHPKISQHFLLFLPLPALLALRVVCKMWKETVDCYLRKKGLTITESVVGNGKKFESVPEKGRQICQFCTDVNIHRLTLNGQKPLSDVLLASLCSSMQPRCSVNCLTIGPLLCGYIKDIIAVGWCELHLTDMTINPRFQGLGSYLMKMPQPEKLCALTLSFHSLATLMQGDLTDLTAALKTFSNLVYLRLTNFTQMPSDLHEALSHLSSLQELHLGRISILSEEVATAIGKLWMLRSLHLEHGILGGNNGQILLEGLHSLKHLDLRFVHSSSAFWQSIEISSNLPLLQSLTLSCYMVKGSAYSEVDASLLCCLEHLARKSGLRDVTLLIQAPNLTQTSVHPLDSLFITNATKLKSKMMHYFLQKLTIFSHLQLSHLVSHTDLCDFMRAILPTQCRVTVKFFR